MYRLVTLLLCVTAASVTGCTDQGSDPDLEHADAMVEGDAGINLELPDANMSSFDAMPKPDAQANTDAAPADNGIPIGEGIVPVVTPSVCTTVLDRLLNCHFGPVTLIAPQKLPPNMPCDTRVTAHQTGDCSTAFALKVRITAQGIEPLTYVAFQEPPALVVRADGSPLDSLLLEDASPFAGSAAYHDTCRIWLEVEFNEPSDQSP